MPVAESADGLWLTFADVGLRSRPDELLLEGREPFSFHEFAYEITVMRTTGGEVESTMDRAVACQWLPDGFSGIVLEIVGACCRSLLELTKPQYIYRVTFMPEPTEKALKKHHYITQIIESLGFSVLCDGTDPILRKFWLMGEPGVDLPPRAEED
jgi:hypothetical protein